MKKLWHDRHGELRKYVFDLLGALLALFIFLKITYYKESLAVVGKVSATMWYTFILPGYAILFAAGKELSWTERLVLGGGAGIGLISILSYYAGLLGLHIKYHAIVLPTSIILIAFIIQFLQSTRLHKKKVL